MVLGQLPNVAEYYNPPYPSRYLFNFGVHTCYDKQSGTSNEIMVARTKDRVMSNVPTINDIDSQLMVDAAIQTICPD